jgi:gas vesicle protein
MGFLDRLFGRTKETADDIADEAAPAVDKAQDAAGEAWEKAKDTADDVGDAAKDRLGGAADEAKETAEEAKDTASDASRAGDAPGPSAA